MRLGTVRKDAQAYTGTLSLDPNQRIDPPFGNEQVLAVHLQHYKPILVQSD